MYLECKVCGINKEENSDNFHYHKNKRQYRSCRDCRNKEIKTKYYNTDKRKSKHIESKYKITKEEYDSIMSEPCAICGKKSEHLDHCHSTGNILGGLCSNCNRGLGHFQEDSDLLTRAVTYLKKHKKVSKKCD